MSLRVALVASARHPVAEPFAGGLESHVWHLAHALRRDGHHVEVVAAPGTDPDLVSTSTPALPARPFEPSDLARRDVSMPPEVFLRDHHAYLSLVLDLAGDLGRRFDVVHDHSLHHLPVSTAHVVGLPFVTTLHTPPTPWLESAFRLAPPNRRMRVAAVSRHTARAWSHVVPEATVVPNGVDAGRWPVGPGGGPLVWTGRIVPEKAPHLAIDAARLAGRPLVLAGPVHDVAYHRAEIEPRLGADVAYAGHLGTDDLARLLGTATAALVTPRWDEPYGLVTAEALACGTPVIVFDRGGVAEILTPECGVVVPPDDVGAMARAVPRAAALSRTAAAEHARRACSIEQMARAYVRIYRELGAGGVRAA